MFKAFFLLLGLCYANMLFAQQPNDCINAITICGNGSLNSNAIGRGDIQEVSSCGASENNSIWLKINIEQSGTLGLEIIPNNTALVVDYDFWVFGPNVNCNNLSDPIRCSTTNPIAANNTTNHTGMDFISSSDFQGPGADGTGFVNWLDVNVGESYFIVIDRYSGSGGFSINWNGSATQGSGAFPTPPTANQIEDLVKCNNESFNLDAYRDEINNDLVNNTIEFYRSLADATDGVDPLPNVYEPVENSEAIYAKVTNSTSGCSSITQFNLISKTISNINLQASSNTICASRDVEFNISGDAFATITYEFDGGDTEQIQLNENGEGKIIKNVTSQTELVLTYVEVPFENGNLICEKSIEIKELIEIGGVTIANDLQDFLKCDADKDGKAIFDLTLNDSLALSGVDETNYNTSYYKNETDAQQRTEKIVNPNEYLNDESPQQIWVRIENNQYSNCYAVADFKIETYSSAPPSFDITQSNSNLGETHQIIISNVEGIGTYEFSVEGREWKTFTETDTEIVFNVKGGGEYSIIGRHTEGCGETIKSVIFIDYPKFFTPNNDGYNDFWNIKGGTGLKFGAKISIFNRFGKLLKIFNNESRGWDGTFNGKNMPSGDYWFLLEYEQLSADGQRELKKFKSNFTLLR